MMKKTFTAIAFSALALLPLSAFAQNPAPGCPEAGQPSPASCRQPCQPECDMSFPAPCPEAPAFCPEAPAFCPEAPQGPNFDGLNLSAEQKSKLESLAKEQKAHCDKNRKERKDKQEKFRQQRDKEQAQARENAKKARRDHLKKIKEILTPEQYIQFLENNYLDSQSKAFKHGKSPRHHKAGKATKDRKERRDFSMKSGKNRKARKASRS